MLDEKFIKIMALTTSPSDGEALAAIRKANQILAVKNLSWEEVFRLPKLKQKEEPIKPGFEERKYEPQDDGWGSNGGWRRKEEKTTWGQGESEVPLAKMFRTVKSSLQARGSNSIDFVDSLEADWAKYGRLTPRQYAALKKFYDNAVKYG